MTTRAHREDDAVLRGGALPGLDDAVSATDVEQPADAAQPAVPTSSTAPAHPVARARAAGVGYARAENIASGQPDASV